VRAHKATPTLICHGEGVVEGVVNSLKKIHKLWKDKQRATMASAPDIFIVSRLYKYIIVSSLG